MIIYSDPKKRNPKNDPDVERGYQKYQKEYKEKQEKEKRKKKGVIDDPYEVKLSGETAKGKVFRRYKA